MEKHCQPTWMQTVTRLNALKSGSDDAYFACNLTKVLGQRRYLYSPACTNTELDCVISSPSKPSYSRPSQSSLVPGGLHMWEPVIRSADFPPSKQGSPPLGKASCSVGSDAEAPSCMSQSTEVTESSWILRTLHQLTFSNSYLDPYAKQGYERRDLRYLYGPPSKISTFVDEGLPPRAQICPDKWKPEAKSVLTEADEPPAETIQNHGAPVCE